MSAVRILILMIGIVLEGDGMIGQRSECTERAPMRIVCYDMYQRC